MLRIMSCRLRVCLANAPPVTRNSKPTLSNMRKNIIILWVCLMGIASHVLAQETTVFTDPNLSYKKGMEFFNKGLFGAAKAEFQDAMQAIKLENEPEYRDLQMRSELFAAKCAIRLQHPDSEKLMVDFIRKYSPEPIASQAVIEAANYYYNDKQYKKALEFLDLIVTSDLSAEQRSEVLFKKGYVYFVNKKFSEAKEAFRQIKETKNEFYYPSNYYYGMTQFFEGNYNEATKSFEKVSASKKYKSHIPYYLAQIYFAEGSYDQLINYAVPKVNDPGVRNRKEINQLIGQAYFEKRMYPDALPYLEQYADGAGKMREEDFYQLAFTQYQTGHYEAAAENFEQLSSTDSKMGQNALYNLADCYIRMNQKEDARNAFGAVSRMNYDPVIQEEALFNFGKLSYELNQDRDAITAFQKIPQGSRYYFEAQELMGEVFLNTRDYSRALKIMDDMPNLTPQMQETYQKVAYLRGLQLYSDGNTEQAKKYFTKAIQMRANYEYGGLANFWLGDIAHKEGQYPQSMRHIDEYLTVATSIRNLPDEASVAMANYTQGYNLLKQKDYNRAAGYFQNAVSDIRRNSVVIQNDIIKKQVLADAVLRSGDALFKLNQYDNAITFYNEAIQSRYKGFVYALYQKAIIEGLRGQTQGKIIALEDIVQKYPKSEYTDDALLQLGITYQEQGRFKQAKQPLNQLVSRYRGKSDLINQGLIRLGLITYNEGNATGALEHYKEVFDNNPTAKESEDALAAIKEIYVNDLGQTDAYFAFLRSIKYDVDDAEKEAVSFRSAEAQFENGNYPRAIDGFTRYLRQYPNGRNQIVALYHRGDSYSVQKQFSNALRDYETVVQKGQSKYYVKALEKAAIIAYNHEQDFRRAYDLYTELEKSASSEDRIFEAQLGALRSAYRIGNTTAVYRLAEQVAGNPRASQDQNAAANFYLGKVAYDQKDYNNALPAFEIVKANSDNELTAEARYLAAYIVYQRRDLERATEMLRQASRANSSYPNWMARCVILLSDVYSEKGDFFRAKATLEALLANYNEDQELVREAQKKLEVLKKKEEANNRILKEDKNSLLELDEGN